MKTFITDDFLLQNDAARILYHDYAEKMPIFDYHCHLDPYQILENSKFENIADAWLNDDHYKWRLMRANGVEEKYITGNAAPKDKFLKWADTISRCIGNPLYHWSNMELLRYCGVDELLTPDNAEEIWEKASARLNSDDCRVRSLIKKSNVHALGTTDDPIDDLKVHQDLAADPTFETVVLPAYRPDKALHPENPGYIEYIAKLGQVGGKEIRTFDDLKDVLNNRAEYFKARGCLLADHSFSAPDFTCYDPKCAEKALQKALAGEVLTKYELDCYQTELLSYLGTVYHRLDFTMQLHMSVSRNLNTPLFLSKGVDMGGDAIGESMTTASIVALLDRLARENALPRTVLYTLNPSDTARLVTLAGCFQSPETRCKIQVGSAWWFNDHLDGMEHQMSTLANMGILSGFIGMLTDSRSFLSYARHEYFRRVLCNLLGTWIDKGLAPKDYAGIGSIVEDICYNNAVEYIGVRKVVKDFK